MTVAEGLDQYIPKTKCDTRSIFKPSKAGLNSEFSSP